MENNQHIDQIIRSKFENFEPVPPESIWENVRSKISPSSPPASISGMVLPILAGIAIIISIVMVIVNLDLIYSPKAADMGTLLDEQAEKAFLSRIASYPSQPNIVATDSDLNADSYSSITPKASNLPPAGNNSIPVRKPFSENKISKSTTTQIENADNQQLNSNTGTISRETIRALRLNGRSLKNLEGNINNPDLFHKRKNRYPAGYVDYANPNRAKWTLGAYFAPEFMHYPKDSIDTHLGYSFSLNPTVHFGNYFIRSGVGMRFTKDNGNYLIDYQKYIGSYEDVLYITLDSTAQGVVPTYYTQTVDVYDTIDHYAITQTNARYTYLEIPLQFGYQKDFGKFSLSAMAGPSMSLVINRNVPKAVYPEENIRIVNVNQVLPTRVNLNWQLIFSAGFGYKMTDRFTINVEPTFRYFINPEFNSGTTTSHPYSFGIRAGVVFKLKD